MKPLSFLLCYFYCTQYNQSDARVINLMPFRSLWLVITLEAEVSVRVHSRTSPRTVYNTLFSPPVERHATGEKKTPGIESTLPCPSTSISPLFYAAIGVWTTRARRLNPRAEILSSSKWVCVPHIVQRFRDLRTPLSLFFFFFLCHSGDASDR